MLSAKKKLNLIKKYLNSPLSVIKGIYPIDFYNDYPFFYQYATTYNLFNENGEPKNDLIANAISKNKNEAIIKTIMETLERYYLTIPEKNLIQGYFLDFKDKLTFINPNLFFHFYENNINLSKNIFFWTKVKEINSPKNFYIPAQLIYIYPFREKKIRITDSTGAAANFNLDETLINSLYELIERDAFAKFFYEKRQSPRVDLNKIKNKKIKELIEELKDFYFDINVFDITTDINIPVFTCFLIDKTGIGPALTVGASANLDFYKAIYKSITECLQTINSLRDMMNIKNRKLLFRIIKNSPIAERLLFWANKRNLNYFDYLLKKNKNTINVEKKYSNLKLLKKTEFLSYIKEELKKAGIKVFWKLISPNALSTEFSIFIIKAVSYDLIPLSLTKKNLYLKHKRLKVVVKNKFHPLP